MNLLQEYEPVCALKDGIENTYSNKCKAQCDNAEYLHDGECII